MEEDENKLNESFISRWSKRKSGIASDEDDLESVSYTHLTLPTKA